MFGSVHSAIVFLVALLTLGPLALALLPRCLPPCALERWRRLGRCGRAFAVFALVFISGLAVSKEPLRGTRSQPLPDWFVALGYDSADTDGDGIPDCWETWTRTNPDIADSCLDFDFDGVDNLGEFQHQCDPLLSDTDGDGIDDATEIIGLAANVPDLDPLVCATFAETATDTDGDGIPDMWEYASASLFAGVGTNGFPTGYSIPSTNASNYDVVLTITSSRYALLSWRCGLADEECLLPPCTNLEIRLRLDSNATQAPSLCAVPQGATNAVGTWRATMSAAWDGRREQSTEGARLATGDGTIVDCEAEGCSASFSGAFGAVVPGLRGGVPGGDISISFVPKWLFLASCVSTGCWEHGPEPIVEICETNMPPPYVYTDGIHNGESWSRQFSVALGWLSALPTTIVCRPANETHTNLVIEAEIGIGLGHCLPSSTNLLPITALDGFNAMTNHAPTSKTTPIQNDVNCPDAEVLDIYAGWGGSSWERDFETIPTGEDADDLTSHCIALDWEEDLEIDLEEYLPGLLEPYKDSLSYRVNGDDIDGSTITVGEEEPDDLFPEIYHVEMCNALGETLDRLWVSVLSPKTGTEFATWVSNNATNAAWLTHLPQPPSKIIVNASGAATLPSAASASWNAPEPFPANSYMHPKAVYELRSDPVSGGHGHQATYDANGNLITESIKAGTADYASPASRYRPLRIWDHKEKDVEPYIMALQLDGNPVVPVDRSGNQSSFWTRNLSRPPLRVGPFTQQYLDRRPTTPTGILNIP